jgi:hypothetical protein
MDHLQSSEERKERWHAKNIEPRLMPVKTISLNFIKKHYDNHNNDDVVGASSSSSSLGGEVTAAKVEEASCTSTSSSDHHQEYESCYVPGIPASLLHDDGNHRNGEEIKKFFSDQMQNHGFVVIRNVLNIPQCNHAIKLAWDYLEAASFTEKEINIAQQKRSKNVDEKKGTTATTKSCMTRARALLHHNRRKGIGTPTPSSRLDTVYPKSVGGRIFPFYGAGHSTFQWYIRSQHYVQDVFATIYNVDRNELITSLDGMILWIEYDDNDDEENSDKKTREIDNDDGNNNIAAHDKGWFHIDQNPQTKPKSTSIQGLVNLLPVTENTGGNVLVMGSHRKFPDHYLQQKSKPPPPPPKKSSEKSPESSTSTSFDDVDMFYYERLKEINGDDWLEIDPNDEILLQKESVIMCLLGAGDMIVWDSRLVHCSYPGKERKPSTTTTTTTAICDEDNNNALEEDSTQEEEERNELKRLGLTRAAGLVNMIPRVNCSIDIHNQRIQAIQNARTLTHWVDKASPLGEERNKEVELEQQRVQCMWNYYHDSSWLLDDEKVDEEKVYPTPIQQKQRILLSLDDLTAEQRNLV